MPRGHLGPSPSPSALGARHLRSQWRAAKGLSSTSGPARSARSARSAPRPCPLRLAAERRQNCHRAFAAPPGPPQTKPTAPMSSAIPPHGSGASPRGGLPTPVALAGRARTPNSSLKPPMDLVEPASRDGHRAAPGPIYRLRTARVWGSPPDPPDSGPPNSAPARPSKFSRSLGPGVALRDQVHPTTASIRGHSRPTDSPEGSESHR